MVPSGVVKETTSGGGTLRLKLDRVEMTIADRLHLTLEVDAGEAFDVTLPKVGDKLQQFGIRDYTTLEPKLVGEGKVRHGRSYVLEPFLSGDYKIAPMKISFRKKGDPAGKPYEAFTEEVTVKVTSLLPEDAAALDVADIVPPVELPARRPPWLWWAVGGVAALLVALVFLIRRLRRRGPAFVPPPTPAHEIAYGELERLVSEDLVGQGLLKEFYQRISGILRRYIENRFGLHAPERTTEEFLVELSGSDTLTKDQKELLKAFLTHCDMVKFAKHEPGKKEIQRTFDSCKTFIEQTKEVGA